MENYSDVFLGGIEIKEAYEHKSLEVAYGFYKSAYNNLAEHLTIAINVERKGEQNVERILNSVFQSNLSPKGDDLTLLIYRYRDFLRQFNNFLDKNDDIYRQLSIRGLDKNEIEYWRVGMGQSLLLNLPRQTGVECLQFMVCSKYVVENLTSLYKHFCKTGVVSEFAYEGCKLLGVTWADFMFSIRQASYGLMVKPVYGALQNIINGGHVQQRILDTVFSTLEKTGAAFAEYPYCFKLNGCVLISPMVNRLVPNIQGLYNKARKMELDFHDACGMAVALFDYQNEGRIKHCVSFSGTRIGFTTPRKIVVTTENVITDVFQYISLPSIVYFAAVGILKGVMMSYPQEDVYVFGHSLGGGLAQFSCAAVNSCKAKAYCYNSAGLGDFSLNAINKKYGTSPIVSQIQHICSQHDYISCFGTLLQNIKYIKSESGLSAHGLKQLNVELNGSEMRVRA